MCPLEFVISQDMKQPIFVYYQLENFYQNHRRYVKSRSYKQLRGESLTVSDIETDCDPIVYYSDLYDTQRPLDQSDSFDEDTWPANPCGLVAKSFFNDTFSFQ